MKTYKIVLKTAADHLVGSMSFELYETCSDSDLGDILDRAIHRARVIMWSCQGNIVIVSVTEIR
jgi:hypothetical protein